MGFDTIEINLVLVKDTNEVNPSFEYFVHKYTSKAKAQSQNCRKTRPNGAK